MTATFDGTDTTFKMVIDLAASAAIKKGKYFTDVQKVAGVTCVWGKVVIDPQVTVLS